MIWWTSAMTAGAWTPAELRPVEFGPTTSLAVGHLQGAPAVFVAGPDGLRVVDPGTGETRASTGERYGDRFWVGDLDRTGMPEILVCGERGISLLRGDPSVAATVTGLTDVPCERLTAFSRGAFPSLVSIGAGGSAVWTPSDGGLVRTELPVVPGPAAHLAASGPTVVVEDVDGRLQRIVGDEVSPLPADVPVDDVIGLPGGEFAVLALGQLWVGTRGYDLDGAATALVADGADLWVTDGPGKRIGFVAADGIRWSALPVAPERAVAGDLTADQCPDLVVADAGGTGALVLGACEVTKPLSAMVQVPAAPPVLLMQGTWQVLEVRVGDLLATRVADPTGRDRHWGSRGGPPGFVVGRDGTVEYRPSADEVGRWRVSVRAEGVLGYWSGFELRVWPREGTVSVPR